ncbi:MAG: MmcQ/YjbR family DNA-binding protein [Phycisphaerales bacterium]|nr:MmcQ/YjbR family DNA-binding protein [Phycisphaerales bacterium]
MSKKPAARSTARRRARARGSPSLSDEGNAASRRAISALKKHCLSLPHVTTDIKWGDHAVYMIGGKMFAIFDMDDGPRFSFKCDDDDFDRLCDEPGIIPAPYAARFAWVQATHPRVLAPARARALLAKARDLALAKLPKRLAHELA